MKEFFKDIHILHLSDLHIHAPKAGRLYNASLDKLIEDIDLQLKGISQIILVITGDIIDKGDYSLNAVNAAEHFFEALNSKIGDRVIDIEIVPGNHDKERNITNQAICEIHQKNPLIVDATYWDYILISYKNYLSLKKRIYEIFSQNFLEKDISNTFGVRQLNVGGQDLIFVQIDTAWVSSTKNDDWKLAVGEYQRSYLIENYQHLRSQCSHKPLTIALAHHPIKLLNANDASKCNDMLLKREDLNADIFMCGHVHDVEITHYFNQEHSLLTLVTGIGGSEMSKDDHRYSIYMLNLLNNSCDIIMRRSGQSTYTDDFSIYVGEKEMHDKKLTYPIRVAESHPHINIGAQNNLYPRSLFFDNELLCCIPNIHAALGYFVRSVLNHIAYIKTDWFSKLVNEWKDQDGDILKKYEEAYTHAYDYFYNAPLEKLSDELLSILKHPFIFDDFLSFLQELCDSLIDCLNECCFSDGAVLRSHFRVYNQETDMYETVCVQYNDAASDKENLPQTIKFNELINLAMDKNEPLVSSLNPHLNKVNTDWDDFITIVPDVYENKKDFLKKSPSRNIKRVRPCIICGLSIKSSEENDFKLFRLLAFLRIDEMIQLVLSDYISLFNIHLPEVCNELLEITHNRKKGEHKNYGK